MTEKYLQQIKIEHKFYNLKQNKRIKIRYDKNQKNYLGFIYLALSYDLLKYINYENNYYLILKDHQIFL